MKKTIYLLTALTLIPIILTYFSWGSSIEMVHMIIMFLFFIGLFIVSFDTSSFLHKGTLIVGTLALIILFMNLTDLWFDNEGGDPKAVAGFTIQWLLMLASLILIYKSIQGKRSN